MNSVASRLSELTIEQRARLEQRLREKRAGKGAPRPEIPRRGEGPSPLSFAQQRMWFLDRLEPGSPFYNGSMAVSLGGRLDLRSLRRALDEVARRHEALRTTFAESDDRPVQLVSPPAPVALPVIDLSDMPVEGREARARELAGEEARTPFDLSTGPLFRCSLLRLAEEEHVLLITMHHIVSDGWSMSVMVREVSTLYAAFSKGEESPLSELPIQYADYAAWQRSHLTGEVLETQLDYWKQRLAGAPPVLELPTDRPRPARQSYRGGKVAFTLDAELTGRLKAVAQAEGCTLFMALLAGYSALVSRYSTQEEVVVGSPVAGRTRPETEDLIGFFVNTLALRTDLSGDPTFVELLRQVRESCLGAYAHQEVPFERLVEELAPERSLSHHPLFQTMLALQNAPREAAELAGLRLTPWESESVTTRFDLSLSVVEEGGRLLCALEYMTDLFDAETVGRMAANYAALLGSAVAEPGARLSALDSMTGGERRRLLRELNDTAREYPGPLLHQLFERQAAGTPERVALVFESERLTYGELNRRANRLARLLRRKGVGAEERVALLMERSAEMVVSLLAVLKAGGAYVPLDPTYPDERLRLMLADVSPRVALTQSRFRAKLPECAADVLEVDGGWQAVEGEEAGDLDTLVGGENLAYVIYTSGSTGMPKGAMNTHKGIRNRLLWMQEAYGLDETDRVLQKTPYTFDVSVWEFFWPLITGARLVLARPEGHRDGRYLAGLIAEEGVTTLHFVPSMLQVFLEEPGLEGCRTLRRVVCSGEALPAALQRQFFERSGAGLHNLYGPTEAAVDVTFWECARDAQGDSVPIGRPIANTQIYVLDRHMRPAPLGAAGELHIGGVGVGRGYLARPSLTAERFIPDPFSDEPGARLYRTGDVVKYAADGRLEYLGRTDHQVKIRGFRIELGEIEAALRRRPEVREAVVVARDEGERGKRLVAYVVAAEGASAEGLRERLRERLLGELPEHMAPASFVLLDEMPLSAHGKINLKALPAPVYGAAESEGEYVAPASRLESRLAEIWQELLGVRAVGTRDNFFHLGGHSLLATQLLSRVRRELGVEIPLRSLFEAPTVVALAQHVRQAKAGDGDALVITRAERGAEPALSYAQRRLWFLHQLEPESAAYNLSTALRLTGRLDAAALGRALSEVARRHEALRTTFAEVEGQPVQVISPAAPVPLPVTDLSTLPEAEREGRARELTAEEARRPFDLSRGPLFRSGLLRLAEEEHVLLVTMHHVVSDGWSMGVLLREVKKLYAAFLKGDESPLAELPIQYADYAAWQRGRLTGEVLENQLDYWKRHLAGAPPVLELPTDRPRPVTPSHRGARLAFGLDAELTKRLKALAREEGCTLFMALLAGYAALLSRYSGQEDVVVGSPIANRTRPETEDLIGFFVNTLALRTDLSGDPTFRELLGRVREATLGAYEHQEVPFERLVEELAPERSLSRHPLFQTMLALQNAPREAAELAGLKFDPWESDHGAAKFDLLLLAQESDGALLLTLEHSTELFDEATARRILRHYETLLRDVTAAPGRKLSEAALLCEAERRQVLEEWNQTGRDYPRGRCVHELFEEQAAGTPDAVAVVFGEERLSYAELNRRANRLARHLRANGAGPGALAGVLLERTPEMVVALLGILKAGAAYVPLDANYPRERLALMLEDSGAQLVLTQRGLLGVLPDGSARAVCLDEERAEIDAAGAENLPGGATTGGLAYVIYTSGSTGRPKGVAIEHRSVTAFIHWAHELFGADELAGVLASTSICFDLSLFELFVTLSRGGSVILAADALQLPHLPAAGEVTLINTVPSAVAELVRSKSIPDGVRTVNLAGEPLRAELVERVYGAARVRKVYDLYGPSEDTTYSTFALRPRGGRETIGRPIANTRVYMLDAAFRPVPVGVAGELHIGGEGLARGYLNRPAATAERFIPDPFSREPGARLYKTGDLARYLPDGQLEFLGRTDHQVKIRGFRIELGEIEAALRAQAGVREAAVVARDDGERGKRLVAYVAVEGAEPPSAGALREAVRGRLPEFMTPSAFVLLDALPLTPSGKIDRRALPAPPQLQPESDAAFVAPRTAAEELVASIWAEVLGVVRVGVRDSFFEIGGHSLLATQVMSRVRETFRAELPLRQLFNRPTVEGLVEALADEWGGRETVEEVAELLRQVESLPAAEVHSQLAAHA